MTKLNTLFGQMTMCTKCRASIWIDWNDVKSQKPIRSFGNCVVDFVWRKTKNDRNRREEPEEEKTNRKITWVELGIENKLNNNKNIKLQTIQCNRMNIEHFTWISMHYSPIEGCKTFSSENRLPLIATPSCIL